MTYSAGSTIVATDYNGFVGGNLGPNVSGELNTVWGGGNGSAGYGQARVNNVTAITDIVTATQWTTLINTLNAVRKHQDGAGFTNIGTVIAGANINANVSFSSNLTTAFTSRFNAAATGTTVTGSTYSSTFTAPADTNAQTFNITRTATFASADKARYFWNAGGQLKFVIISVANNDSTNRSGDLVTLANTNFANCTIKSSNNSGRQGTGGTLNTNNTALGYWAATTSNANIVSITSTTSGYTTDQLAFSYKTNGVQGSYADNGTTMNLNVVLFAGAQSPFYSDDTINVTVNHRVDVIYPVTTYLANTWGAVTIS